MPTPDEASKIPEAQKDAYDAAGSYQQEIQEHIADEALGDGAATEPLRQGSLGEKDETSTQGTNPKRTENSRPD